MMLESVPVGDVPAAPDGAGPAGKALWAAVVTDSDLAEHELTLLRQAVAVADVCEALQAIIAAEGLLVMGKVHPAGVELRQQRILLARLIVALRVPLGDEDAAGAQRTQYRGVRGVYAVRGGAA
jgi:hypothetical protein